MMATNRGLASFHSFRGSFLALVFASGLSLLGTGSASAVEAVTQTLDSVDAIADSADLSMQFNKGVADRSAPPFSVSALPAGSPTPAFTACQRSGTQDLYCVQSNDEVWVFNETGSRKLFSCRDTALGLDTKSRNAACTSLTVDLTGSIWIAGRKNNTHSVINLVEIPADLPEATTCTDIGYLTYSPLASNAAQSTDFCFLEFTSGRPIILDMMYVDGKDAANFAGPQGTGGRGAIFMEDRKTVSFLPDSAPNPSYPIASGKTAWLLGTKEDLQGVAWYRRDDAPANPDIVLVTTSTGRVLAKNADGSGPVTQVFNAVTERTSSCSTTIPAQFEIRVSQESKRIYVSDRQCKTVSALQFVNSATTPFQGCPGISSPSFKLCNAKEADGATDVTLSTAGYEPTGVSVSPGIAINLRDCVTGTCTLVADGGDTNAVGAQMSAVKLDTSSASGLTVFQIKNIPDCRFNPDIAPCTPGAVVTKTVSTTIKTAEGGTEVVTQTLKFLDVSTLMPEEVLRLFDNTGGLPPMLISPQYRGQSKDGVRYFEGFFGRAEDGVRFRQNFDLLFDIGELVGSSLGCGGSSLTRPDLNWDVVTTVSERYVTASQTMRNSTVSNGLQHVDMLQNTDCSNPTSGSGTRWSFYPYNLELDPVGVRPNPWKYLLVLPSGYTGPRPDVFADLLYSLFDDLRLALEATAQVDVDGNASAPLTTAQYGTLDSSLDNVQDKLDKCVTAAYDKQSAAAQNCSSLDSQLLNFATTVQSFPIPSGLNADKANRIGELRSRALVMKYVLNSQLVPSIPTGGFNQPGN